MKWLRLPIAAFLLLTASVAASAAGKKITEAEIIQAINTIDGGDLCEKLDEIRIDHLEYFDFTGSGQEQAVVVASTCMTGTAGPDIHAVFTRDASGKVVELPFQREEGQQFFSDKRKKLPVYGNPNYGLKVENGVLVARWGDGSDREEPLIIWYRWDGKALVQDHVKVTGPFKTSYDCAKAEKDIDQAICYSPSVAALDLQLDNVYREQMQKLTADEKKALQDDQKKWLAERNSKCVIYKWWVDCLTEMYSARIAELQKKQATLSATPAR